VSIIQISTTKKHKISVSLRWTGAFTFARQYNVTATFSRMKVTRMDLSLPLHKHLLEVSFCSLLAPRT